MASSLGYVLYACEQTDMAGHITYKKMFGEYTIYCDGKVMGLICNNQVFIKPTLAGDKLMPEAERSSPYNGAKPHIVVDNLEDKEVLTKFIAASCAELPIPKPKNKKKK